MEQDPTDPSEVDPLVVAWVHEFSPNVVVEVVDVQMVVVVDLVDAYQPTDHLMAVEAN